MGRGRGTRPTLEQVGAQLGVSKGTVSKVLNDRPGVSDAVRARVREALGAVGYEAPARPGSGHPSAVIMFDTLANLYALTLLDGIVAEGQARGVAIEVDVLAPLSPGPGGAPTEERIRALHARGHAGLMVAITRVSRAVVELCHELDFPLVAVDSPNELDPQVATVGSDGMMGGYQGTAHLAELGHRRIAFVGGSPTHAGLRSRLAGYRSVLEEAGIPFDPELVSERGMMSAGVAAEAMRALPDPPTAFFAGSDPSGLDLVRTLTRAGLSVPGDVSVVSFDDTYATLPAPALLTTVHTPVAEIGRVALGTLMGIRDGRPPVSHHVSLATHLVVRETTAPPRG
ncbi:LacI family DNA-binding transcriptional regulator [Microbacterium excoecariae]|uniref:LacI family DNA-binding transcriptional regulator n=1 Tax=Microbacterium excoecariae TaxID=2715210 RepID=UPI00140A86D4|nr:LacI family DNA-binding transcriptional regulator [Microbacterium excoecariae]NHI15791.1 LacI family transcriptional regulator [Microbacterium excoecariae]